MKNFLILILFISVYNLGFTQISGNGFTSSQPTVYTDGSQNDLIYIWCASDASSNLGSLTAVSPSGVGPFTYDWSYFDEVTSSWVSLSSSTGATSTISNLPSDGYRVQIYDNMGVFVQTYVAWVWNLFTDASIVSSNITGCDGIDITGGVSNSSTFTYYNPPAPESIITASTNIQVCFNATHTWVSDLAFYLVGPASCGSPTILLSPNPGAIGQGSTCNSGDNVSNLCFTTQPAGNLDVCTGAPFTLSGTYSSYGPSNTPINWSGLIGCNAAQSGWAVQIYDCIGADVGALTSATISFTNLQSIGGSPTSISYNSGVINSAINDNSCSASTASIFQVSGSATPITMNATSTYTWSSSAAGYTINNPSTVLNQSFTNVPPGTTTFYLNSEVSINGQTCTDVDSIQFLNTCCPAISEAGSDTVICTGSTIQIGSPLSSGDTYTWTNSPNISNPSVSQPNFTFTNTGNTPDSNYYFLSVYDAAYDCSSIDSILIVIPPSPTILSDTLICNLSLQVNNTQTYFGGTWTSSNSGVQFSNNSIANPTVTFATEGIYQLDFSENICNTNLSAEVTIPFKPVTFDDTIICSTQLIFPTNQISTFGPASWSSSPSGGGFSPSTNENATSFFAGSAGVYQLILTDNTCPNKSDTVVVEIITPPTVSVPAIGCDLTTFDISSTFPAGSSITWTVIDNPNTAILEDTSVNFIGGTNANSANPFIQVDEHNLTYTLNYQITGDCPLSGTAEIFFPPYLYTEINDTTLCLGVEYALDAFISPYNVTYTWNDGTNGPTHMITEPGTYYVTVSNECPTHDYTDMAVIDYYFCDIEAPNVISLSSTNGNNVWFVNSDGIAEFECVILNRWGNVVYEYYDVHGSWNGMNKNGNLLDEGVYFYHIKAKAYGGEEIEKQGSITLVH